MLILCYKQRAPNNWPLKIYPISGGGVQISLPDVRGIN